MCIRKLYKLEISYKKVHKMDGCVLNLKVHFNIIWKIIA